MLIGLCHTMIVGFLAIGAEPAAELNDKNYAEWRDRIRPKAVEQSYETVNWFATFWDAVVAAQKEEKPILLWAMNGHPLACT